MGVRHDGHGTVNDGKAGETGRGEHGALYMNVGIHETGQYIGIVPVTLPLDTGYNAILDVYGSRKNGLVMKVNDVTGDGHHLKTPSPE
jgi:hypothetical protein